MTYDPAKHRRRSIRLRGHDYAGGSVYFVTTCVKDKECLFGEILEGEMTLSDAGRSVEKAWRALPERFNSVIFDAFRVMPNHVHAIIVIPGPGLEAALAKATGAPIVEPGPRTGPASGRPESSQADPRVGPTFRGPHVSPGSAPQPHLGRIVGALKSISAIDVNRLLSRAGRPLWLEDYFEHIVRDVAELEVIRDYVVHNPQRWRGDPENSDM